MVDDVPMQVVISDEQITAMITIMDEFGIVNKFAGESEWMTDALRNPLSYPGGTFEFCNHFAQICFDVERNVTTGAVTGAYLSKSSKNCVFTQEKVDDGNERFALIFK